ncbi:MAG: hypothetical protein BWY63_02832 [Chloroflexi bacterium ADurb.Bin360]|nr:MAG: hypothetical protein BWY63_02832 [Chloroflexi bacterium ADurb.Bin360]
MQKPGVFHKARQPGAQFHQSGIIDRSETAAHTEDVRISKTGETLESQVYRMSRRTAPAHSAPQDAGRQIKLAVISQNLAALHAKALLANDDNEMDPVGRVRQLRMEDGRVIEKSMNECHCLFAGITFFEDTARAQIAVAGSEQCLSGMLRLRIEGIFYYIVIVHGHHPYLW